MKISMSFQFGVKMTLLILIPESGIGTQGLYSGRNTLPKNAIIIPNCVRERNDVKL